MSSRPPVGSALRIGERFNGPPGSANGGYACGCVAAYLGGRAEVRLLAPPPLERDLAVLREDDGVRVLDGEVAVASGRACSLDMEVPRAPTLASAIVASRNYAGGPGSGHPFPGCFVCGPDRAVGDGLRVFPGPVTDGLVAAPFEPPPDLLDRNGELPPEIAWAALDCPGYFAIVGPNLVPMLLGELAVDLRAAIGGGPHVVYAWSTSIEGRKARSGSAIATPDGEVLAVARATWIQIRARAPT